MKARVEGKELRQRENKTIKDQGLEKDFIEAISNFRPSDFIGFARIVGINPETYRNFEDFGVDLVEGFSKFNREKRKKLLRLAILIGKANKDLGLNKN